MSNYYCFTVSFHKDAATRKLKIDYALYPVDMVEQDGKDFGFRSKVSDEEPFILRKHKDHWEKFKKHKDVVSCAIVYEAQILNDLEKVERCYIPELEKRIRQKIPLRFKYKRKLKERLARVIDPTMP